MVLWLKNRYIILPNRIFWCRTLRMVYITRYSKWKVSYLFCLHQTDSNPMDPAIISSCDPFPTLSLLQKKNGMLYLFLESFKLSSIHDLDFPSSIYGINSSFSVPLSSCSSHISFTARVNSVLAFPQHLANNLFFNSKVNSWTSVVAQKSLQNKQ